MRHLLLGSMLLHLSCFGLFEKEEEDEEEEEEQYSHSVHCDTELAIVLPDGTQAVGDFCATAALSAEYEFDPDTPPEIRNPALYFSTLQGEEGFECELSISNPSICSEGYYNLADNLGVVELITLDCEGIADAYEDTYQLSSGYLHIAHLTAGGRAGNFEGQELLTSIGGYIDAHTASGIRLVGDFSLGRKVMALDAEDQSCYFDDGDTDGDGALDPQFGGNDCDDNNPSVGSSQGDSDCDGTLAAEDCDDNDASSTVVANDGDCDGVLTTDDCDDNNPDTIYDMDCDGILTVDDCDDNDASTRNDMDCDGILTANDCDDLDPNTIYDNDCDGAVTDEDCDDFDENSLTRTEDGDCDGVLTIDDCDDDNPHSTIVADDQDCDGTLAADDCNDNDANSTIIAQDLDCDGVLTADDCDDNDASLTAISTDQDCDGTLAADDCDDDDASSTTIVTDADCDGYVSTDDCDDNDSTSTIVANDGDCDGVLTIDDCDDSDPSTANDMDCDGYPAGVQNWGCYSFYTHDDYGDGWGGNALYIYEDNVHTTTIANNNPDGILYNSGGESQTITFCPDSSTSSFYIRYVHGSYPDEISFTMYDSSGNPIGSGQGSGSSYNGTLSFNGGYYGHNGIIYTSPTAIVYDCDDTNSAIYPGAAYHDDPAACLPDLDGDGYAPVLSGGTDCDDNDISATLLPDDNDCDGAITNDDCDDNDAGSTIVVDDPDCDGQLGGIPPLTIDELVVGDLIITEIQAIAAMVSDNYGEWFEIYNNTSDTLNLNGLIITDQSASYPHIISSNVYVPPNTYFVLGRDDNFNANGWVNVDYVCDYGLSLNDSADSIILESSIEILDEVSWGSGNGLTASSGHAMSLDPDNLSPSENDIGTSWCHSYTQILTGAYGTPGVENEQCP